MSENNNTIQIDESKLYDMINRIAKEQVYKTISDHIVKIVG